MSITGTVDRSDAAFTLLIRKAAISVGADKATLNIHTKPTTEKIKVNDGILVPLLYTTYVRTLAFHIPSINIRVESSTWVIMCGMYSTSRPSPTYVR